MHRSLLGLLGITASAVSGCSTPQVVSPTEKSPKPLIYSPPIVAPNNYVSKVDACKINEKYMRCASECFEDTGTIMTWSSEEMQKVMSCMFLPYEEVQKAIRTPREAAIYCNLWLRHGALLGYSDIDTQRFGRDYWMSGRHTHLSMICDCDDAAVAAASLLKDNGFPPYILVVHGKDLSTIPNVAASKEDYDFGHAVFIYKTQEGKIGSIGINTSDVRPPKHYTLRDFMDEWGRDTDMKYTKPIIYDIGKVFPDYDVNWNNNDPEG